MIDATVEILVKSTTGIDRVLFVLFDQAGYDVFLARLRNRFSK